MSTPFRKCDKCSKPAVDHHTVIVNGAVTELHLCAEHAVAAGFDPHAGAPIGQLLGQLAAVGASRPRGPQCPQCGHSFNDFKSSGLLGCPACYDAFAMTVTPVLERAHGATEHVGRSPAGGGAGADRAAELQRLVRELEQAVAQEQYERAAGLRDRIRELRPGAVPGAGGAA